VLRALADPALSHLLARPVHALAIGKAASAMATALATHSRVTPKTLLAIGTHAAPDMPSRIEWHESSHPIADSRSVAAARRALGVASAVTRDECLLLLLSGGASALMALPRDGLTLDDKQGVITSLMRSGADIHALNTVRKHLSQVKGGHLAARCAGTTVTLAISDVLGDDLSVIGSGPGIADPSTWADAASVVERWAADAPQPVKRLLQRGAAGELSETPKPGDAAMARASGRVIASRHDALHAARNAAAALGYQVVVLAEPVLGEARDAAPRWLARALEQTASVREPVCVLSAGETTVHVAGRGRGGRNQEFVLATIGGLASVTRQILVASVGTDGIDGPTDAAGALADDTTGRRAGLLGLNQHMALNDNNAYDFFATLGDLIHLGRTETNVGDVQVLLAEA
jgi:hydroxypyruvate reductase